MFFALTAVPATAARTCAGPAGSVDPIEAAQIFLGRVVERRNPAAGYRFVTSAARHGITCASWTRGRIPFEAYRHIDWKHSTYRRVAVGTGQIVLRVSLRSTDRRKPPESFLLELREEGARWQVGFWGR
jgi:hypothetical protein